MPRCEPILSHALKSGLTATLCLCVGHAALAQVVTVYRCPGRTGGADEFTNLISDDQARERGCRTVDGAPITIIQAPKPRPAGASGNVGGASQGASRPAEGRIDPAAQRQRDSDARRILESELRREEDRLAGLKRDFNNGEPERRGDERNYQQYLDRVAQMRAGVARAEADVAAIKRELAKLAP